MKSPTFKIPQIFKLILKLWYFQLQNEKRKLEQEITEQNELKNSQMRNNQSLHNELSSLRWDIKYQNPVKHNSFVIFNDIQCLKFQKTPVLKSNPPYSIYCTINMCSSKYIYLVVQSLLYGPVSTIGGAAK